MMQTLVSAAIWVVELVWHSDKDEISLWVLTSLTVTGPVKYFDGAHDCENWTNFAVSIPCIFPFGIHQTK